MANADRYSRLVLWLKVSLPLAALAILSTLFFVAETLDPEAAIPYASVDVAQVLRDQGATAPNFGGVTKDGVKVALSASAIRPDADQRMQWTGSDLKARLDLPSGSSVSIDSPIGVVDASQQEAILRGGATLESSTGYRVTTDQISTSLETGTVVAESGIVAVGPPGELTAGRMTLKRMDSTPPNYHLVFQDGVRLVFTPVR
ncbi:MAG: hypothetical protein AAF222_01150 [Pseudomonadota bacterium]